MRMNNRSRSSFFLMELILSVFLFAVAAAACSALFVQTHLRGKNSKELLFSLTESQNLLSEIHRSDAVSASELQEDIAASMNIPAESSPGCLNYYYSKDFSACSKEDAAYLLQIRCVQSGSLLQAGMELYTWPSEGTDAIASYPFVKYPGFSGK